MRIFYKRLALLTVQSMGQTARQIGTLLILACIMHIGAASLGLGLVQPVHAGTVAIPEPVRETMPSIQKMGEGTLRWWGFHVYDAQLWSQANNPEQFQYNKTPHWLVLQYGRDFKGVKIAEQSREEIENQADHDAELLSQWESTLADIFPDVKENDTLSALFTPGKGIQFFHNGTTLKQLTDLDLSVAFMGIWLDSKTSAPKLRRRLIGLSE